MTYTGGLYLQFEPEILYSDAMLNENSFALNGMQTILILFGVHCASIEIGIFKLDARQWAML